MKAIFSHQTLDFTKRDLVIVVANTLEKARKKFNKELPNNKIKLSACKGATALCVVEKNGACSLLFALPKLCGSTICHEVTHATNAMFSHIGIAVVDDGSDEAFAYHNDMLFRKVAKLLKAHNITIPLLPA